MKKETSVSNPVQGRQRRRVHRGLKAAAGGKTGTTDSYMDAWFIGYTKDFVTGVWVGHDKKRSLGKGASGGQVAAPIWLDFMKQVESGGAGN